MFDKDNYQLVKDFKRDVEENIVKYEEILIYLNYSVKPEKFKAQIIEVTKNFEVRQKVHCEDKRQRSSQSH